MTDGTITAGRQASARTADTSYTCPLVRGHVRPGDSGGGRSRRKHPRQPRRHLEPRHICPKGATLGAVHEDPDRIRRPMIKVDGAVAGGQLGCGLSPLHRTAGPGDRRSTASAR